jgi:aminocarboxymuconate-semialdehyde decarboxylase
MSRAIDVHNHLFPMEWIDFLEKRTESPRMERKAKGMIFYSHEKTCSHISEPGHYDVATRIRDMERCGIDTQMLSLTLPSVEELPVEEGVKWARKINDYFAEVSQKYPGRFYAFATLPFQDVSEAVKEIDRAHRVLGIKGITMFSNVNFKPLSSPELYPIYAKAEECGLPIFIHPGVPFTGEVMKQHGLRYSLYGFTFDTTMAVMGLIWQGVLERYPGLNLIHAHLGGIVPYLAQRLEDCWRAEVKEFGVSLPKTPSEYYRRQVYPDSMSAYLPAMKCCLEFVGPQHICMGTDYAHGIGNWEHAISSVKELGLNERDTSDILGGNAARICRIKDG